MRRITPHAHDTRKARNMVCRTLTLIMLHLLFVCRYKRYDKTTLTAVLVYRYERYYKTSCVICLSP